VAGGIAFVGAVAYRALARPRPVPAPGPDPRAEELRRRLAESRPLVTEREVEAAETPVDEVEPVAPEPDEADPVAPELDDRRRRVHEEGRAAARRMRTPPPE
jgi:hypothetical protein